MDSFREAERSFNDEYPGYRNTTSLDELRHAQYERLDRLEHRYLDYTGAGLYASTQIEAHTRLLLADVFGNPHSSSPASALATRLIERARGAVHEFFKASADEYIVVFTRNATGALKLVGESYPFDPASRFLLTLDNHNSVNGIREFARASGSALSYCPLLLPEMRIDPERLAAHLSASGETTHKLFAYPAQSNFSGVQHSLDWIEFAHARGWDVLLDAAAYVPANALDLGRVKPDFVCVSFYKMFGYPTGAGCLIARKAVVSKLHRPWFSGGTITVASVKGDRHYLHSGPEAFEDGTPDYLCAPAIEIGLNHLAGIGYEMIHARVAALTGWMLGQLGALRHGNGLGLVRIYGPLALDARGGTIAFNIFDKDGRFIDHRIVEDRANTMKISLRTGCFCNPGGGEVALGISEEELDACFSRTPSGMTLDDFRECIDDKSSGAVRISFGLVSNFEDAYHFLQFATRFVDKRAIEI
ncbi:MAG: aminotransferase class V-fold PLP-dependent enzyme [Burkholderiales bacterium]|nr:aminotransferase class V-fold PLP-dependent enzyme [Burkholderiales bacterium]